MTTETKCAQCGRCCINSGLIPPLMSDEDAPEWLRCLVRELWPFAAVAEDYPCICLTGDRRCSIYEDRPGICVDFACDASTETANQ